MLEISSGQMAFKIHPKLWLSETLRLRVLQYQIELSMSPRLLSNLGTRIVQKVTVALGILFLVVQLLLWPMSLSPKLDGMTRLYVDYRKLNQLMIPDLYPLIQDPLDNARCTESQILHNFGSYVRLPLG